MILEGLLGDGTRLECSPTTRALADDDGRATAMRLEQALRRRLERDARAARSSTPSSPHLRCQTGYPAIEPARRAGQADVARRAERRAGLRPRPAQAPRPERLDARHGLEPPRRAAAPDDAPPGARRTTAASRATDPPERLSPPGPPPRPTRPVEPRVAGPCRCPWAYRPGRAGPARWRIGSPTQATPSSHGRGPAAALRRAAPRLVRGGYRKGSSDLVRWMRQAFSLESLVHLRAAILAPAGATNERHGRSRPSWDASRARTSSGTRSFTSSTCPTRGRPRSRTGAAAWRPPCAPPSRQGRSTSSTPTRPTAIDHVRAGRNVVIVTGTASGKTLCYTVPVLEALLGGPAGHAALHLPDQGPGAGPAARPGPVAAAGELGLPSWPAPTTATRRRTCGASSATAATSILTNPDMLHQGILPQHARWNRFFTHLRYVVIDEVHAYRGVFGSHLANVHAAARAHLPRTTAPRRSSSARSATIANPREHAERICGRDDGAGRQRRLAARAEAVRALEPAAARSDAARGRRRGDWRVGRRPAEPAVGGRPPA